MTGQSEKLGMTLAESDVMKDLEIGVWALELVEGQKPRMFGDTIMRELLGCPEVLDPEKIYELWHAGIDEDADALLSDNLSRMIEGKVSEVQYSWRHPDGSLRIIRCGGQRNWSFTEGIRCEGTHRDMTEVVHIDEERISRQSIIRSYYNYYNYREALVILLVNMESGIYTTVKRHPRVDERVPLKDEGNLSEYLKHAIEVFADDGLGKTLLNFQDFSFLESHFKNSPVYRHHFLVHDESGEPVWLRLTANKLNGCDMIISLEDRTQKMTESIVLNTISNRLVGAFILNLSHDSISVVKRTPFFNYLDDNEGKLTISKGVEMLCPHIDEEFRQGWLDFAAVGRLSQLYNQNRRADYSFKTVFANEHTWMRASLYAIDQKLISTPSFVLAFRKYTKEELETVDQNEQVLREKEKLERDYHLIKGIAAQYVSLKIVQMDGHFSIIYKDWDSSYGWNNQGYDNFWESYKALMMAHCHPGDIDKMLKFTKKENVMDVLRGRRRYTVRFRFRMVDGSYKWMDLVLIRFDNKLNTKLTEFAYAIADVDQEVYKELEYAKALEQARISQEESRLKTQFVNNISHDIRTPLNAVIGYSQLLTLAGDSLTEQEKSEYVKYIETSGELLTMLIDDILSVSDIEHDILKLRFMDAPCNEICDKAVSCSMMRVPTGVNLYFTTEFDDKFCIWTDPKRVQQILINMLSNSCKATTEGEIHVHCGRSAKEGFVDFVVTDTGCGVPPEKAEEIFNRFVSVDNNDSGAGHGLGLDICIKISQRMGGYIWLDQTYTTGARFVLTLPEKR